MAKKKNKMHIFIDHVPTVIIDKEAATKLVEEKRKKDSKKVKGKFINLKEPGKKIKLPYLKYKGDQLMIYTLEHGKECEIPKGFADQLNGIGHDGYNKITYKPASGAPSKSLDKLEALEPTPIVEPIYSFVEYG